PDGGLRPGPPFGPFFFGSSSLHREMRKDRGRITYQLRKMIAGGRDRNCTVLLNCGKSARCEKGSGTFVRSTLRAVPAKVPDPFSHLAGKSGRGAVCYSEWYVCIFRNAPMVSEAESKGQQLHRYRDYLHMLARLQL